MTVQKKNKRSVRWLLEHFKDEYVIKIKNSTIRSRAWFKLEQIDKVNKLFKRGMNVLDLGAAPGSWSQYAKSQIGEKGYILSCDILPIQPIPGVKILQGDIAHEKTWSVISKLTNSIKFHLVMSDIAPNITGNFSIDMPRIINLSRLILNFSNNMFSNKGVFLLKSFQGEGFNELYKEIQTFFKKVKICKPKTSRARSREIFILATR